LTAKVAKKPKWTLVNKIDVGPPVTVGDVKAYLNRPPPAPGLR